MELRELEQEAKAQREEIAVIEYEVEGHSEEVLWLEEAVGDMEVASQLVNSPRLDQAMKAAFQAHAATEERLETLRAERDEMRLRNQELQERCRTSAARKQEALGKIRLLMRLRSNSSSSGSSQSTSSRSASSRSAASDAQPHYARMAEALEYELESTAKAVHELEIYQERLEGINL